MASPITTGGFGVSAQPGINYLPISQITADLGGILPAVSRGASLVSQLQGIRDEAVARPIKRQMDQIKLQEAQDALLSGADEHKLRGLRIAAAEQPLERIVSTDIARIPRILSPNDAPALDANGNPTFEEGDTNYDLVPVQKVEVTDPTTGEKTVIERRLTPIMTSEQLGERQDKLEISRLREESLGTQRRQSAQLAAERLNSPDWKRVGYGTDASGKQVFVIVNSKTGEKQEVPTDLMPVQSGLGALGAVLQGITGGAPTAAPRNIAAPAAAPVVAAADTVAIDEETQAMIDELQRAAAPASAAPSAFKNMAEAEAAAASGLIKKGQKITVGGQSGTWQ